MTSPYCLIYLNVPAEFAKMRFKNGTRIGENLIKIKQETLLISDMQKVELPTGAAYN